jgi:hypothetical protein
MMMMMNKQIVPGFGSGFHSRGFGWVNRIAVLAITVKERGMIENDRCDGM